MLMMNDQIDMSTQTLHITPIPAFNDNYIWLLHNYRQAVVIDPGDAAPVLQILDALKLKLSTILITHYHADHIDGVAQLLQHHDAQVYAPKYEQYSFKHIALADGDEVRLECIDLKLQVMWLPGHTLGHIVYVDEKHLFCGDVLFGAGCGRLFEGTPTQMFDSLNKLKALDSNIKVYCTHEYTAKNIDFAIGLEPNNQALTDRKNRVSRLRKSKQPTLPSTIDLELKTNPFLRCNQDEIIENSQAEDRDELSVFTKIRMLRNHY